MSLDNYVCIHTTGIVSRQWLLDIAWAMISTLVPCGSWKTYFYKLWDSPTLLLTLFRMYHRCLDGFILVSWRVHATGIIGDHLVSNLNAPSFMFSFNKCFNSQLCLKLLSFLCNVFKLQDSLSFY